MADATLESHCKQNNAKLKGIIKHHPLWFGLMTGVSQVIALAVKENGRHMMVLHGVFFSKIYYIILYIILCKTF